MSYAECVTLFRTRQSHAVRFSFMPMVMKLLGLKPIEAQNARSTKLQYVRSEALSPIKFVCLVRIIKNERVQIIITGVEHISHTKTSAR
jgi:hypothetical protein